jgi:surface protein
MSRMFYNSDMFNGDITTWDTAKVQDMSEMFNGAMMFNQDLSKWDFSSVNTMSGMFDYSGLSDINYNKLVEKLYSQKNELNENVELGAKNTAVDNTNRSKRLELINDKGWVLKDNSVVVTVVDRNGRLIKISKDGEIIEEKQLIDSETYGSHLGSCIMTRGEYIYLNTNQRYLLKFDFDGNLLYERQFLSPVNIFVNEDNDDIFISYNLYIEKINEDLSQIWRVNIGEPLTEVAVDYNNQYIYIATDVGQDNSLIMQFDMEGNELKRSNIYTIFPKGTIVDNGGNIYIRDYYERIRKYNSNFVLQWTFTGHSDYIDKIKYNNGNYIYSVSRDATVKKISTSGSERWSFGGFSSAVSNLDIDLNEFVYAISNQLILKKIRLNGAEEWSLDLGSGGVDHNMVGLSVNNKI